MILSPTPSWTTIRYAVRLANHAGHVFPVKEIAPNTRGQSFAAIPAWNPLYQVHYSFGLIPEKRTEKEENAERPLPVRKRDKQTRQRVSGLFLAAPL